MINKNKIKYQLVVNLFFLDGFNLLSPDWQNVYFEGYADFFGNIQKMLI